MLCNISHLKITTLPCPKSTEQQSSRLVLLVVDLVDTSLNVLVAETTLARDGANAGVWIDLVLNTDIAVTVGIELLALPDVEVDRESPGNHEECKWNNL